MFQPLWNSGKNITCGEEGTIICQDAELVELFRQKRLLGMDRKSHTSSWKERSWFYEVKTQDFRYYMSNINAAIGLAQLKKIDSFISRRREICRRYDSALKEVPGISCLQINYDEVAPHIYVIRVKNGKRDKLMAYLKGLDIETGINYIPNHLHPFYRNNSINLPETEKAYQEILTLPLHYGLSNEDVDKVIQGVIEGVRS